MLQKVWRKKIILPIVLAVAIIGTVTPFLLSRVHHGQQYDIVVVGAGPGGVAASLQAARMGAHVALLEPTDWIGGQMTSAGVGNMDEGGSQVRDAGVYKEFIDAAKQYYASKNESVGTCYGGGEGICVDPKVGQQILRRMLAKQANNLQVFTNTEVTSVLKDGTTVKGVNAGNKTFSSKVVVDADEYGDILPLAGANYRIGNGTNTQPPTSKGCIQDITYTEVMRKYDKGAPANLTFKKPPPGYTPELVAQFKKALANGFAKFAAFRGFPDDAHPGSKPDPRTGVGITRTSLNLDASNDYPLKGTLSTQFLSDKKYRADAICKARLLTLQLTYYIQHDLGEKDWSIANDEGYDTIYNRQHRCAQLNGYEAFEDQMSQEPYVREGRRLIGQETLTGHTLAESWEHPKDIPAASDSIAVGYYPMDMHSCRTANTLEAAYDQPTDAPLVHKGGPFDIPLGTLIPQNVDGLLVAEKNISVSRLANGAIREQPVSMDTGQAVGALAAIAVEHNEQPRMVPAQAVQDVLAADNLRLSVSQKVPRP